MELFPAKGFCWAKDRLLLVLGACKRYATPTAEGSTAYARLAIGSGIQAEAEALALDAWSAVAAFRRDLE